MTADRRLLIGGWAALIVALAAPIEVIALFLSADGATPLGGPVVVLEIARVTALLLAVLGLDRLFRSIAPAAARPVRFVGTVAAVVLIALDLLELGAVDLGTPGVIVTLASGILVGVWFIGSGAILLGQGGGLARVGWTAELGGLGNILAAVAVAISLTGPGGDGITWLEWFRILGLFAVVYLVRVWRYVVGGKLPGPGIL